MGVLVPFARIVGNGGSPRVFFDWGFNLHRCSPLAQGTQLGDCVGIPSRSRRHVAVVGIDPDPKALARARRKPTNAAVSIQFDQVFRDDLPYAEVSFDRVFSSFMFHHLPPDEKVKTLRAVQRVLKRCGFHTLDFEGSEDGVHGVLAHLLHSSKRLKGNSESRVLSLIRQAMLFGHIAYFRAGA